jgi:plasmid stabilization system protein ParE
MLADAPGVGKRYAHRAGGVRRVLMRSTRNHVYYVEQEDRVLVVAVWGAVKGAGPDLSGL